MNDVFEKVRTMKVARVWEEADEIKCLDLEDAAGEQLPLLLPGAHIDLHLQGGTVRQYSICNGPDQMQTVTIAVKRESNSRGGSLAVHRLKIGDEIAVTGPRNSFPLDPAAKHHLLLAAGIGITPLLSMARHLKADGKSFSLGYFARSPSQAAFQRLLSGPDFAGQTKFFYDVAADDVRLRLQQLFASRPTDGHVYACGPRPFMNACVELAGRSYPKEAIHLEFFSADEEALTRPQEAFKVRLARRRTEIDVPSGVSIIDALARHGVQVDMLCQQGVCGTCLTDVLGGIPDHRDTFLTDSEKHANDKMMICCSRARSPLLILDL